MGSTSLSAGLTVPRQALTAADSCFPFLQRDIIRPVSQLFAVQKGGTIIPR